MPDKAPRKALSIASSTETRTETHVRLTDEQVRCLRLCASGISLRFEAQEIVDALVAGGYVTEGPARVVTVTAAGLRYLQDHEYSKPVGFS